MEIAQLYKLFLECGSVSTDTRKIASGAMFFALKGENFDGNAFAEAAIEAGAKYAVVSSMPQGGDSRYILVEDTLLALQELAKYHREQFDIPILGITGTNGKTTTKELINSVLSSHFNTLCTEGNLNNHIGVPLTLLRLNRSHQIAVIEMGASHQGEIASSVNMVQPSYGLVTNVGKAHLEGFGSFEGVKQTKGELYDWLSTHNGLVFYNGDNPHLVEMLKERNISNTIPYGITNDKVEIAATSEQNPYLSLTLKDKDCLINTSLIGNYNADNLLAALAVGCYFGVPFAKAVEAIENYKPSNSRSQLVKTDKNILIIDAYNANLDSMRASLTNFATTQFPNKVLVLGDMLELGVFSKEAHSEVLQLAHQITSEVYLVGKSEFKQVATPADKLFDTSAELKDFFAEHPLTGRTILIKGSNSNKLGLLKEVL